MLRRVVLLLAVFSCVCAAQTSYDRMAAAVKLWAYIKYCHPYATASDVDWDAALARATPKILASQNDYDFETAVNDMLAVLKDPTTRVITSAESNHNEGTAVKAVITVEDGTTVVRLGPGNVTRTEALRISSFLPRQLTGTPVPYFNSPIIAKGTVLFDIRGSKGAQYALTDSLPVAKDSIGPSQMVRAHFGYASDNNSETGGVFRSYWEMLDGARISAAPGGRRAIFLVNHETDIPRVALAMQESGAGAIVSEDQIDDSQIDLGRAFTIPGELSATVRTSILSYSNGTTGLTANVVLRQTGSAALKAALEMAKSGNWPPPAARPMLKLPPARFNERDYGDQPYPSAEYRMIAAARVWGVFHYFHPYRHLYEEDWDSVLLEFLPKMAHAGSAREYHELVAEMVARVHDSHCSVTSSILPNWYMMAAPPVELRWIENQPVVTRIFDQKLEVRPGDIVTRINGEPFQKRTEELEKHISASTPQSLLDQVMFRALRGPSGSAIQLTIKRGDEPEHEVSLTRIAGLPFSPYRTGNAFRLLNSKLGYVDMQKLATQQVDVMFDLFRDTDAIIMDMRGYPQGTFGSVAARLAEKPQILADRTQVDLVTAGTRVDDNIKITTVNLEQYIPPTNQPRYKGKTVMLIDERAMSQAEHSGLFYRAANGTKFIGTPTAGADGTATFFTAPGGIRIDFSGADVQWPDGKQLQRVGLIPDIEVQPTIAGIRAGRDEVLERAVGYLENGR